MGMDTIKREYMTVESMIRLYCRKRHNTGSGVCDDCTGLLEYAVNRLEHCRFGNNKPVCSHCPNHCYRLDMRDKIRLVMRFSGPRMLLHHPYLAFAHLIHSLRGRIGFNQSFRPL
ncbi:MAG: nitrous oxide-stimulated promoter family protein [Chitinispirillaceae bacterium]|nr:nitrous oxide-stimulated promoter family protein [Chitinispirillaceae bacterium]